MAECKAPQPMPKSTESCNPTTDPFKWIEVLQDSKTQALIQAETAFYQDYFADKKDHTTKLFEEIKSRIQLTDTSVPFKLGNYFYYSRTFEHSEYIVHCRKKNTLSAPEEVFLNENKLSEKLSFFDLGSYEVSQDGTMLAYTVDTLGDERYTLYIKNLLTDDCLVDRIENVSPSLAWSNDNQHLYYIKLDKEHRPYQVYCHQLGQLPTQDRLLHTEWDERFFVDISHSKSNRFIQLSIESKLTCEIRLLSADSPESQFETIYPRQQDVRYYLDDLGDHLYIMSNEQGRNFGLYRVAYSDYSKANWQTIIAPSESVSIESFDLLKDYLVVTERHQAISHLRVISIGKLNQSFLIEFPDAVFNVATVDNYQHDSNQLRLSYESLTTPEQILDFNCETKNRNLLKTDTVLGNYDRNHYQSERLFAQTESGCEIPISLVYHKDFPPNAQSPCLLTGYGAYGHSYDIYFSKARLSLLNRGFVFAIAHIRGGGDCGEVWHDAGKLEYKQNSFSDFAACANHLKSLNYTSQEKLVISGGSAGGLLIGAVLNQNPNLCDHAILDVPFVDMLNTMQNPNLPLTITEYEEWGDPNDPAVYQRLLSYSPYENISAQPYPHAYVTCGLQDCRVSYWEALKWVQMLRLKASNHPDVRLKINQEAGHGGATGRFSIMQEIAEEYCYLLSELAPHSI